MLLSFCVNFPHFFPHFEFHSISKESRIILCSVLGGSSPCYETLLILIRSSSILFRVDETVTWCWIFAHQKVQVLSVLKALLFFRWNKQMAHLKISGNSTENVPCEASHCIHYFKTVGCACNNTNVRHPPIHTLKTGTQQCECYSVRATLSARYPQCEHYCLAVVRYGGSTSPDKLFTKSSTKYQSYKKTAWHSTL